MLFPDLAGRNGRDVKPEGDRADGDVNDDNDDNDDQKFQLPAHQGRNSWWDCICKPKTLTLCIDKLTPLEYRWKGVKTNQNEVTAVRVGASLLMLLHGWSWAFNIRELILFATLRSKILIVFTTLSFICFAYMARSLTLGLYKKLVSQYSALITLVCVCVPVFDSGGFGYDCMSFLLLPNIFVSLSVGSRAGAVWCFCTVLLVIVLYLIHTMELITFNQFEVSIREHFMNMLGLYISAGGALFGLMYYQESLKRQLKQSESNTKAAALAKERFLASMSHEMRTPLMSILNFIDLILEDPDQFTSEHLEWLEIIKISGTALKQTLNDVLDFSSITEHKLRLHNSAFEVHREVLTVFRAVTAQMQSSSVEFFCDISDRIPEGLRADGKRVSQVLRNLLSNAIHFTHQGYIKLTCELISEHPEDETTAMLQFCVADTGVGIAPEMMKKIFVPFEQGDNKDFHGGTGLGLAISRKLCELMGGKLWVASEPNAGSSFYFTVACSRTQPAPANSRPPQEEFELGHVDVVIDCQNSELKKQTEGMFNKMGVKYRQGEDVVVDIKSGVHTEEEQKEGLLLATANGTCSPSPRTQVSGTGTKRHLNLTCLNFTELREPAATLQKFRTDGEKSRLCLLLIFPHEKKRATALVDNKRIFSLFKPLFYKELSAFVRSLTTPDSSNSTAADTSPCVDEGVDVIVPVATVSPVTAITAVTATTNASVAPTPKKRKKKTKRQATAGRCSQNSIQSSHDTTQVQENGNHVSDEVLNILLVDDNLINRKVCLAMLNKLGQAQRNMHFVVSTACSGEEAIAIWQTNDLDVIFMDHQMPTMSGLEAAQQIRQLEAEQSRSRVPICSISAGGVEGDPDGVLDCQLNKPFNANQLKTALLQFVREKFDVTEQ